MLAIVDYGSGNLRSVQKAFEHVGVAAAVVDGPAGVRAADGLVLPGVGSFGHAMQQLDARGLIDPLREQVAAGVPFLGVCLGLQLLFTASEESPGVAGLGLLPGTVARLPDHLRVPHIGWNQIEAAKESDVFDGVPDGSAFYFVHSYAVRPSLPGDVLTLTEYEDVTFVSGVERENLTAFQFHPEKSSLLGLQLYRNFARRAEGRER